MYESRDILQEAIELAHLGLAELNAEEIFVSMTSAYCSMLGKLEIELIGQHWSVAVHPDDHALLQEAYRLARATGRGYVEIRALRHDSTVVYQAVTVTGLSDENGEFRGYHCLRHDISGFKRDQEALARDRRLLFLKTGLNVEHLLIGGNFHQGQKCLRNGSC